MKKQLKSSSQKESSIGVVLLSYNGGSLLVDCLKSLGTQKTYPQALIVVDNGSHEFSSKKLAQALPEALRKRTEFIVLKKNVGYAKGMNTGIMKLLKSKKLPEWIMTLNQDARLAPQFFEQITKKKLSTKVGMLSPKVLSMQNPAILDGTGIQVSLDGMSTARGQREKDKSQYDREVNILVPNGVAALYRSSMLKEVGLFDEDFWSYCEDTDLGLRGWLAGWDGLYVPECRVLHKRSASMGEHSLKKLYFTERNHFWVAMKNFPLPLLFMNPTFTFYRYLVQLYALALKKGQGSGYSQSSKFDLATITLKAVKDALEASPRMLRKRQSNRSLVKRTTIEIFSSLLRNKLSFSDLILK